MPIGTTNTQHPSWAVTLGTTNQLVVAPNPSRNGLCFINNGGVAVTICPANQIVIAQGTAPWQAGQGSSAPLPSPTTGVAVANGAGSITMQPNDKFIIDNLPAQAAWNGVGAAPGAALTVLEML
jgi:hypothetical protein